MKNILLLLILLISTKSFAKYDPCESADTTMNVSISRFAIDPPVFYAKVGDKICLTLTALETPMTLRVQSHPIYMKATPDNPEKKAFIVRKAGEFELNCTGCVGKAKLIVETEETFRKKEDEYYRYDSHLNRRNHYIPNSENSNLRQYGK